MNAKSPFKSARLRHSEEILMIVFASSQQVYSRVLLGLGKDSRDLTKNKIYYRWKAETLFCVQPYKRPMTSE
jgi:hypothetical protein